ncbi:MAG: hypothetical protein R3F08_08155 [Dokdonella sp.]
MKPDSPVPICENASRIDENAPSLHRCLEESGNEGELPPARSKQSRQLPEQRWAKDRLFACGRDEITDFRVKQ